MGGIGDGGVGSGGIGPGPGGLGLGGVGPGGSGPGSGLGKTGARSRRIVVPRFNCRDAYADFWYFDLFPLFFAAALVLDSPRSWVAVRAAPLRLPPPSACNSVLRSAISSPNAS